MDIGILLFFQAIRENIGGFLTTIMVWLSTFSVTYLILIPIFIYWCVDKKKGLYTLTTYYVSSVIGSFIRLSMKVNRPWIKDPRVVPDSRVVKGALKGYSFPSYTTSTATALYGGIAVSAWEKVATRVCSVLCWILVGATAFSRIYLGVSTIWEVLVGFAISLVILIAFYFLFNYLEQNPDKENFFLFIGIAASVIWYFNFKLMNYPSIYTESGDVIVNGADMAAEGFRGVGMLGAFCVSRLIEKKWIKFEATGFSLKGIITTVIGLIPAFVMIYSVRGLLAEKLGENNGALLYSILITVYVILVYPIIIAVVMGTNKKKQPAMSTIFNNNSNKEKKRVYRVTTDQK